MANNKVELEFSGNANPAIAEADKLTASFLKMSRAMEKMSQQSIAQAKKSKSSQKEHNDSLSIGIGQIAKMAAGYLSVEKAVGLVTDALKAQAEIRKEAAEKLKASELGMGALSQLSLGDPAKEKALRDQAKELFKRGGAPDMNAAAGTIFELESANLNTEENRKLAADMFPTLGADMKQVFAAASSLTAAMGEKEVGSFKELLSKGFQAAAFDPSSMPEVLAGAAKAAAPAKVLGWTDEQLLGALGTMSQIAGGPEKGATTISSLGTALSKEAGFQGLSTPEAMGKLTRMGFNDDQLVSFLGDEATAWLQDALGKVRGEARKKLKGLTLREKISEMQGWSTEEVDKALGPDALAAFQAATGQYGQFAGMSPVEAVKKISGFGLSDPQLIEFLGRKEAFTAYQGILSNADQIEKQTAAISSAQGEGNMVDKVIAARRSSAEAIAIEQARAEKNKLELTREHEGIEELILQSKIDEWERMRNMEGGNKAFSWLGRKAFDFQNLLLGPEAALRLSGDTEGLRSLYQSRGLSESEITAKVTPPKTEVKWDKISSDIAKLVDLMKSLVTNTKPENQKTTVVTRGAPAVDHN